MEEVVRPEDRVGDIRFLDGLLHRELAPEVRHLFRPFGHADRQIDDLHDLGGLCRGHGGKPFIGLAQSHRIQQEQAVGAFECRGERIGIIQWPLVLCIDTLTYGMMRKSASICTIMELRP